jgi:hypothetical protein
MIQLSSGNPPAIDKGLDMNKYRVTLELEDLNNQYINAQQLEGYLLDLVNISLSTLNLQLLNSTTTKKKG